MHIKPTVLIVDDDMVSLNLLTKLVEKLSFDVVAVADGNKALLELKSRAVDLVIADYEMPQLDGLQLLKAAKTLAPKMPYILVTAYSNLRVIREAWEFGAFDFFQKPVFVDRLHQTVRLAIDYGDLSISRRHAPRIDQLKPDPELLDIKVVKELAAALERVVLAKIVDEFETHARIEFEQLLRFSMGGQFDQVRALSHRLAGSAINLGLSRVSEEMRAISVRPEAPIRHAADLGETLERSIHWLGVYLTDLGRESLSAG